MLRCWLLRQLQCKWDSNMWYCVSRYHSSLMTSFLEDIIPSWLNFQIAYVALLVAEAVTVQMRQQYVILCFKIPFLLDDIIPWRHHSFLIKISDCICCTVGCWGSYSANETAICDIVFRDTIPPWLHCMLHCWLLRQLQCKWDSNMWYCVSRYHSSLMTSFLEDIIPSWLNFQIAYVALLVAEAVTVQMRQQYVILCFKIPFLLEDISFLIKLSDCICCAVGCWGSYSANETAICDIVFQDTIPPWWLHSWRHHSFLIKLSDCICCAVGCWGSYSANETAICDIVFQDTIPPWWHHSLKTSFLLD